MGDEDQYTSESSSGEEEEEESESEEEIEEAEEESSPAVSKTSQVAKTPAVTETPVPNISRNDIKSPETVPSTDNSGARKMSEQRKMQLKSLMLNKARQDLEREAAQKAKEKKATLAQRIEALENLRSMSQQDLMDLCRELHAKIDKVDEQRFDIEARVKKNDQEIQDLNQKIFDLRGKFKRPPLRRVRVSADQMLRALLGSKHKVSMDLRSNLKAVKKVEGKKEDAEVKDWRDNIEAKAGGMGGKMAVFEGAKE